METKYSIERLPEDYFSWQQWRCFNLLNEFGIACRSYNLIENKAVLRKYAIGFIEAEKLRCRPKENCYAVMFLKDDVFSWFHLRKEEFEIIFGEK